MIEAKRLEEQKRQQAAAAEAKRLEELKRQQEAKKPKCQPPDKFNPYDTSCKGLPGASPTGVCPMCTDFK